MQVGRAMKLLYSQKNKLSSNGDLKYHREETNMPEVLFAFYKKGRF